MAWQLDEPDANDCRQLHGCEPQLAVKLLPEDLEALKIADDKSLFYRGLLSVLMRNGHEHPCLFSEDELDRFRSAVGGNPFFRPPSRSPSIA